MQKIRGLDKRRQERTDIVVNNNDQWNAIKKVLNTATHISVGIGRKTKIKIGVVLK